MILVFDSETTGLVNMRESAAHPSQPSLVQLACLLLDDDGTERQSVSLIVRPDGWDIPEGSARVHGITTEIAKAVGVPLRLAVATFTNLRAVADVKVAHNLDFDELVMATAIYRLGVIPASLGPKTTICTMKSSTDVCQIPGTVKMKAAGFDKFKPPNLQELHQFLFKETFAGAHDAMADCRACARCYLELRNRGVVK